jgi:hypothetical protein
MNADDDPFIIIPTTAISQVGEVRLYEQQLKVLLEKHPELALPFQTPRESISNTVAQPTHVYESATNPGGSFIYISTRNTYENNPLVVPIKVIDGTSGRVQTAYYSERTGGGALLWSDSNE